MAKSFAINTEPHQVTIGDTDLYFQAEANGAEFLQASSQLSQVQTTVAAADPEHAVTAAMDLLAEMNTFITKFLEPESVPVFAALDVPFRVTAAVVEYLAELYGGGSEERPTTSSSGSARRSGNPGKRG